MYTEPKKIVALACSYDDRSEYIGVGIAIGERFWRTKMRVRVRGERPNALGGKHLRRVPLKNGEKKGRSTFWLAAFRALVG